MIWIFLLWELLITTLWWWFSQYSQSTLDDEVTTALKASDNENIIIFSYNFINKYKEKTFNVWFYCKSSRSIEKFLQLSSLQIYTLHYIFPASPECWVTIIEILSTIELEKQDFINNSPTPLSPVPGLAPRSPLRWEIEKFKSGKTFW